MDLTITCWANLIQGDKFFLFVVLSYYKIFLQENYFIYHVYCQI